MSRDEAVLVGRHVQTGEGKTVSDACACAELHANHVHDGGGCTVRCPACCAASWDSEQ